MGTPRYKVALAQFPGSGQSRMETNAWVVQAVRRMDRDPLVSEVVSLTYADTPITMLRNRAVREARDAGCHYLLMIDSDMAPDIHPGAPPFWTVAWEFLMARRMTEQGKADEPLRPYEDGETLSFGGPSRATRARQAFPPATIAAPYCGPPPDECVYVFHWTDVETNPVDRGFRLEMVPRAWAAVKSGIEEVAALPTGLILYDMRVFDLLAPPWFRYEFPDAYESEKATTEDVYQTRNASLLGLPQFCAWDCWAGHLKVKRVCRPTIVTRDQVHRTLADAVLRGVDSADRLIDLPASPT